MIVYGRNPVREAERGPRQLLRKWEDLPDEELERICGSPDHQGVCAEVDPYPYADAVELLGTPDPLIVALDEVTAAVCKASAGAVEHLAIARVRNLADFLAEAKEAGTWVYGAESSDDARPYDEPDYSGGVVLVMGAEGKGLRPRVRASCDVLVSLPLRGRIESLNVSAAAAVLLYEAAKNRPS